MSRKLAALLLALTLSTGGWWGPGRHRLHVPGHWYRGPVVTVSAVAR